MTILEKLSQHYNVKKDGDIYEFTYIEEDSQGMRHDKTYRNPDSGIEFKETEDGKDWTDEKIKPTSLIPLQVGMRFCLSPAEMKYAKERFVDCHRKIFVGILQTLIVKNLTMETPIHMEKEQRDGFTYLYGYVFVHENGKSIL